MNIKDPRFVFGLLMIAVAVLIFATAITYEGIGRTSDLSTRVSNATADSALNTSAIPARRTVFAERCAHIGVINCFSFDTADSLHYNWPTGTICDRAFKRQTNYGFGRSREGRGNTIAVVQNGQCVFPEIDTATYHSGTGSLRITIPSNSSADSGGHFTEVFRRDRHGDPDGTYIGPRSPLGNVLYFQFYQRFDENFLSTDFRCSGGECGGWKQAIWYGNPPNGASASSLEVTINNGWQRGLTQMYGQAGSDYYGIQDVRGCFYKRDAKTGSDYTEPPCIRYKANQWMEFTGRIEILGKSNQPTSRVQLWIDGEPAIDYKQAKIDWSASSGEGFGQFLLSPYHTNKDASQVHPVGHVWYDDLIISTQPIPMGIAVQ